MSFLPHASSKGLTWYGSLTASAVTHGGVVAFFMFSGMVAFLPEAQETAAREPEFAVSLEILDAEIVEETDVIDESSLIPPDAVPLDPDDLTAGDQPDDLAALTPDEDALVPEDTAIDPLDDTALAPDEDLSLPEEADLTEPEALEPEATEPEVTEPDLTEPEVIDPEPTQPEVTEPDLAEVLPDDTPLAPEPEPVPVAPLPEPEEPSPLAIDSLSPIDDSVLNPLAQGGAGPLPDVGPEEGDALTLAPEPTPDPDVLALVAPEPEPEPPVTVPDDAALAPVVLPDPVEPEVTEPAVVEPEVTEPEITEPEIVAPEVTEPEITEPEVTEPEITEPEVTEPEITEPEVTDPVPTDPEVAEPETGDEAGEAVADAPAQPVAQPLANPTASDIAIGQLLRRIRATSQPQCTLALPRRAGGDPGAGVSFVGADLDVLDELSLRITDGLGFEPVQTREEIDPRQCATLDVLRQSESYPASRIGLALDDTTLSSGDTLSGRVIGADGLFVTLLLIDDNGVVQDMAPFVTLEGDTPVFEAPVARSGPVRATRQILLALATQDAPIDLSDRIGNVAQTVFAPIPADTLRSMVFGVATFDVR